MNQRRVYEVWESDTAATPKAADMAKEIAVNAPAVSGYRFFIHYDKGSALWVVSELSTGTFVGFGGNRDLVIKAAVTKLAGKSRDELEAAITKVRERQAKVEFKFSPESENAKAAREMQGEE